MSKRENEITDEPTEDVEGQALRSGRVAPADAEDDAEGHKHRFKGVAPADPGDDAEGHALRSGR